MKSGEVIVAKDKIADIISLILSAPLFAIYLFIILIITSQKPEGTLGLAFLIVTGLLFLLILPTAPIVIASRKGETDIYVLEREKRPKFFAIAIISYLMGSIIYKLMAKTIFFLFLACYATVTTAIMVSTLATKTSVHMAGIAGPVTFFVIIYGINYIILYLLLLPVAWARYEKRAHNLSQLVLGAIIAIITTWITLSILT